jgi:TonB family protein
MGMISGRIFMRIVTRFFAGLLGVILVLGVVLSYQETSQKIDPFYLERLRGGEQAFYSGDFETAVEEMKIAVVGLGGENELLAKAYLYLGLSYYQLKNAGEAKTSLRKALDLLDMEGLRALIENEAVWDYLNRVMIDLGIQGPQVQEGAAIQFRNPGQGQMGSASGEAFVKRLGQQIKSNPRNVDLYYELYDYYREQGNTKEAKKTLEDLIKKNRNEGKAYYLLGRIQYQQRDLKNAEQNLQRVFAVHKIVPVEDYVLMEAQAYLILTSHLLGEKQGSYRMFAEWADRFTAERIRYLDLDEQDRAIFLGIAGSEGVRAEIERMAIEAQSGKQGAEGGAEQGQVEAAAPIQKQQASEGKQTASGQGTGGEKEGSIPTQQAETEGEESGELKDGDLVPLEQVDVIPVLTERVDPKYPPNAFTLGIEGNVVVNALISEAGDVVEVVVVKGLDGGFDEATVRAVRQWKFSPAVKDGVRVKTWKLITVTFRLKKDLDISS